MRRARRPDGGRPRVPRNGGAAQRRVVLTDVQDHRERWLAVIGSIRTPHPRTDVSPGSARSAGSLAGSTVRPSRSGGNRCGAGRPSEYDGWHGCPATAGRRSAESCSPMSRAIANDGLRSSKQSGRHIRAPTCHPAAREAPKPCRQRGAAFPVLGESTRVTATAGIRWLAQVPPQRRPGGRWDAHADVGGHRERWLAVIGAVRTPHPRADVSPRSPRST